MKTIDLGPRTDSPFTPHAAASAGPDDARHQGAPSSMRLPAAQGGQFHGKTLNPPALAGVPSLRLGHAAASPTRASLGGALPGGDAPPRTADGRVRWSELCRSPEFAGQWVALDAVRYDDGAPIDGEIVDADGDLAALCARVQSADEHSCAILFCDGSGSGIRRAGTS